MYQLAQSEQQILEKIRQLPQEKILEVEHFIDALVQQNRGAQERSNWEQEIAMMASDLEIQAEISAINAEFSIADLDGMQNL